MRWRKNTLENHETNTGSYGKTADTHLCGRQVRYGLRTGNLRIIERVLKNLLFWSTFVPLALLETSLELHESNESMSSRTQLQDGTSVPKLRTMPTRLLLLALPLLWHSASSLSASSSPAQAEADAKASDCILAAAAGETVTLRRLKSELPAHCHSLFSRPSAATATTIAAAAPLVNPQVYALDVHLNASSLLPSSIAPSAPFITSLFASWVVPKAPTDWYGFSDKNYLWPGLKSQSPTIGFPVIQPVLQYVRRLRSCASFSSACLVPSPVSLVNAVSPPHLRASPHLRVSVSPPPHISAPLSLCVSDLARPPRSPFPVPVPPSGTGRTLRRGSSRAGS